MVDDKEHQKHTKCKDAHIYAHHICLKKDNGDVIQVLLGKAN